MDGAGWCANGYFKLTYSVCESHQGLLRNARHVYTTRRFGPAARCPLALSQVGSAPGMPSSTTNEAKVGTGEARSEIESASFMSTRHSSWVTSQRT